MSAEKFKVSNSLQSILGLIMLNEDNCLCLLSAPRCAAPIWVFLPASFCTVNSATVHCMCGAWMHKSAPGEASKWGTCFNTDSVGAEQSCNNSSFVLGESFTVWYFSVCSILEGKKMNNRHSLSPSSYQKMLNKKKALVPSLKRSSPEWLHSFSTPKAALMNNNLKEVKQNSEDFSSRSYFTSTYFPEP